MSDVFVSYKVEDRRRVRPLVDALEAEGYLVWWDEQIGGGAAWRQAIETELNAAKCVIVAWSKRSVGPDGTFVQDEATRAQQRRVYVPVTIDKVHLPLGFGETQALPLTGWKGERTDPRYQAILSAVRRLAGDAVSPAAAHPPPRALSRRTIVTGGAAAGVAIAAGGAWMLLKPDSASASDSIAVLPFANLSGDPAQAYFSDGIAEELRSALARLAGLKVVGRTSSEAVKNDDAETVARKLDVSNILTGSVRQSPSTIRVSAQLIDGRSGMERWSQNYDRAPGDAIKIQTDIAENVARALSITLGGARRRALTVGGTQNPEAQKLLFQALEAIRRGDRAALQQGITLADAAIRVDPKYAEAYAQKALFQNWYASTYARNVPELISLRNEAMEIARTALRIAPGLPSGHRALAEIYRVLLDLRPALREYRRALELAPHDPGTLSDYAFFVATAGGGAEAIRLSDQAIHLDPLNVNPYVTRFMVLMSAQRFEEAARFSQDVEKNKPHLFVWPEGVAYALIAQGKIEEARPYLIKASPDDYNRLVNEAVILARTGRANEIEPIIARMRQLYGDAASYQYGQVYAQAGDRGRAFTALERAWEIRDSGLLRVKTDPYIEPIRSDPRYAALLRKLNFPVV
jgi:serine/threonine-protein kinase